MVCGHDGGKGVARLKPRCCVGALLWGIHAVRDEGLPTTVLHPGLARGWVGEEFKQGLFVIALQNDDARRRILFEQAQGFNHATRIGATVNIVSQKHQEDVLLWGLHDVLDNEIEELIEKVEATVDVADSVSSDVFGHTS